eukprot:scaffold13821_cov30-Tisochrysis_lutea.AAC.2
MSSAAAKRVCARRAGVCSQDDEATIHASTGRTGGLKSPRERQRTGWIASLSRRWPRRTCRMWEEHAAGSAS